MPSVITAIPVRRRQAVLSAIAWALASGGHAAAPSGSHVTRQGMAVQQHEEALLGAMRERHRIQLEQLLSDEFEMTVAADPERPTDRGRWIDSVLTAPASAWQIEHLTVRDWGPLSLASFLLTSSPNAGQPSRALFVVDAWRVEEGAWRLVSRHTSWARGSARDVPGYAPAIGAPKKY